MNSFQPRKKRDPQGQPSPPAFSHSACAESGDLTCCDECPRVFHEECLPAGTDSQLAAERQTEHDPWYCPACTHAGRVNLIDGVRLSYIQSSLINPGPGILCCYALPFRGG